MTGCIGNQLMKGNAVIGGLEKTAVLSFVFNQLLKKIPFFCLVSKDKDNPLGFPVRCFNRSTAIRNRILPPVPGNQYGMVGETYHNTFL